MMKIQRCKYPKKRQKDPLTIKINIWQMTKKIDISNLNSRDCHFIKVWERNYNTFF